MAFLIEKLQQAMAGQFKTCAMQIDARVRFNLSTAKTLCHAAIKTRQRGRFCVLSTIAQSLLGLRLGAGCGSWRGSEAISVQHSQATCDP
jgi:hypothetical protein